MYGTGILLTILGDLGIGLLIINLIVAIAIAVGLISAKDYSERGTNKFTKFVRNSTGHAQNHMLIVIGLVATAVFTLIGLLIGAPYAGLPTLGAMIFGLVGKKANTNQEGRVENSRYVTKVATEAAPAVGVVAGTAVAAAATGGASLAVQGAAMAAAAGAGKAVGEVGRHAGNQMKDQKDNGFYEPTMQAADSVTKLIRFKVDRPELFTTAKEHGFEVKGENVTALLEDLKKSSPKDLVAKLNPNMSEDQQAYALLKPSEVPEEAFIDVEFREV